ncbi:hypothetical protein RJ45_05085 [Photobacterium gaetbulicola]|uniref:Uncharacterized protein n=1 Tax=Photobacterium gaetbulicola TaxID=1295392 RepID=A0A0B9H762_9GAMM|nr:hypothetical protein [Photobacterium gaetbulicola]KHT64702.1 hypothetical protein RJ45_05085 [Photobacterium gaetbulicola]
MNEKEVYLSAMENRERIDFSLKGIEQYDLLLAAYSSCGDGFANAVGYCLQIREGDGEVGSDNQVFLRHADGSIRVHHQQAFYRVADKDKAQVLSFFETTPKDESIDLELTCPNGINEVGFRVKLRNDCYS